MLGAVVAVGMTTALTASFLAGETVRGAELDRCTLQPGQAGRVRVLPQGYQVEADLPEHGL